MERISWEVWLHVLCGKAPIAICLLEQKKATLRRVEIDLDEADDIVCVPSSLKKTMLTPTFPGITTRSRDPRNPTFHQGALHRSAKASQSQPHEIQETLERLSFPSCENGPTWRAQALRHVELGRPLRRAERPLEAPRRDEHIDRRKPSYC